MDARRRCCARRVGPEGPREGPSEGPEDRAGSSRTFAAAACSGSSRTFAAAAQARDFADRPGQSKDLAPSGPRVEEPTRRATVGARRRTDGGGIDPPARRAHLTTTLVIRTRHRTIGTLASPCGSWTRSGWSWAAGATAGRRRRRRGATSANPTEPPWFCRARRWRWVPARVAVERLLRERGIAFRGGREGARRPSRLPDRVTGGILDFVGGRRRRRRRRSSRAPKRGRDARVATEVDEGSRKHRKGPDDAFEDAGGAIEGSKTAGPTGRGTHRGPSRELEKMRSRRAFRLSPTIADAECTLGIGGGDGGMDASRLVRAMTSPFSSAERSRRSSGIAGGKRDWTRPEGKATSRRSARRRVFVSRWITTRNASPSRAIATPSPSPRTSSRPPPTSSPGDFPRRRTGARSRTRRGATRPRAPEPDSNSRLLPRNRGTTGSRSSSTRRSPGIIIGKREDHLGADEAERARHDLRPGEEDGSLWEEIEKWRRRANDSSSTSSRTRGRSARARKTRRTLAKTETRETTNALETTTTAMKRRRGESPANPRKRPNPRKTPRRTPKI